MRKILIAEDNVEISNMMKSYLERQGMKSTRRLTAQTH